MAIANPTIAVLGSGPSGCYTAQFLRKKWPDAEITILEALPVPYGLLRYGVATDHQGTKAIEAQFDRLFERDGVQFAGNVHVGHDISFERIADSFDIVVRATGLRHDRKLSVEADACCNVIGAGALLKALNGYPALELPLTETGDLAPLGRHVAVIGNGNVAMDVIRLLCKSEPGMIGSDVDDRRLSALRADGVESIEVFGRSPAGQAKFDLSMLKEVVALGGVRIELTGITESDTGKIVETLLEASNSRASDSQIIVRFHFGATPKAIANNGSSLQLSMKRAETSDPSEFYVDSIISATGFTNESPCGSPCTESNWIGKNVFKVGWLNRDGKGAIAENRKDAKQVAELICEMFDAGRLSSSKPGFNAIRNELANPMVDFSGWKKIDNYEKALAPESRCRKKVTDIETMLAIANDLHALNESSFIKKTDELVFQTQP
ncbi:oxidoreductase [Pseudomonas sp. Teo4]|uniref:oxidoreductase n=1 Tax=Pseudomonas sp. Teo4 TaxID=3064528 RepID=UPI002ABAFA73|nr:oxidoreductase [Pseudomonas sp. Teo4]MDZ3992573.1 NADPH-ferredoxin reductase FprA [Pseudomonas sp. Teo4]